MSKIFLEILNTGIVAGWLVLAVLLVRLPLKKAPAWAKCALWAIVGLRLVWPFEIESILSLIPSAQTLPPAELYAPAPQVHTGIPVLNSAINPVFTPTFTPEPMNSVNPLQVATIIASWVWIIGMVAMTLYTVLSYLRLRRLVRVSMPEGDGVYLCDHIASPFILGIFKPRIYLPSDLPREKWDSILAHEWAHLARRDHWWKPLGFLLLTVFWFHPLLWVAYILLCRDVELACDEKVIAALSDAEKQDYSQVLLECSVPRKWISACPLAFGETGVKQRVKAVLHYKKPTLWILIIALIACTVLAVCFLTEPQRDRGDTDLVGGETVYVVSERMYNPALSFHPDLDGKFRITVGNLLQFDYEKQYTNRLEGWNDVGRLEQIELTEENFDKLLSFTASSSQTATIAATLRADNQNAWRVNGTEGCFGTDGFFLEQKNGDYYYLYGTHHLFKLTKTEQPQQTSVGRKIYIHEKENSQDLFQITVKEDGTFTYSEGIYYSHLGTGTWKQEGDILCLTETRTTNLGAFECDYYFRVTENSIIFQAASSNQFPSVKVADGTQFFAAALQGTAQQPQERNLVWVQVETVKDGHMLALDSDRNRWHIILPEDIERLDYTENQCWVSFYGTPEKLTDTTYGGYSIQYEVTATACWDYIRQNGVFDKYDRVRAAYDYCLYDIDRDGVMETCIISHGFTSGIFTIMVSVWDEETCEFSQQVMTSWAKGYAFVQMEDGLQIRSSTGGSFYLCYLDGEIRVLRDMLR